MDGRPARSVLLLCLAFASFGTVWGSQQAVIAELGRDFGFDESQLGLLLLLPPLFGVPSALFGSRLVARFGSQKLIGLGAVIVAASLIVLAAGHGDLIPWVTMAVAGAGAGFVDVGILTAGARLQGDGGRPVLGRIQAVFFIGLVVGGGIAVAIVAAGLSYRLSFVVAAVLLLAACGLASQRVELPASTAPSGEHLSVRAVLALAGVPVLLTLAFGGFFLEGAITSFAAVLLRNELESAAVVASTAAFAVTIGLALGAGAADVVIARVGARRTMAVGAAVAAVGVAAAATASVPFTAIAGLAIASFGFGGIGPAALTLTGRIDQEHGGGALPTVTALSYLAFLFGPVAVGQLGDVFGLRIAFGVVALVAAGLAMVALTARLPQTVR